MNKVILIELLTDIEVSLKHFAPYSSKIAKIHNLVINLKKENLAVLNASNFGAFDEVTELLGVLKSELIFAQAGNRDELMQRIDKLVKP